MTTGRINQIAVGTTNVEICATVARSGRETAPCAGRIPSAPYDFHGTRTTAGRLSRRHPLPRLGLAFLRCQGTFCRPKAHFESPDPYETLRRAGKYKRTERSVRSDNSLQHTGTDRRSPRFSPDTRLTRLTLGENSHTKPTEISANA